MVTVKRPRGCGPAEGPYQGDGEPNLSAYDGGPAADAEGHHAGTLHVIRTENKTLSLAKTEEIDAFAQKPGWKCWPPRETRPAESGMH